jgi:hypothetical protein
MRTRVEDAVRFGMAEEFGEGETTGGVVEFDVDECNYAAWDQRSEWAAKGAVFEGYHSKGGGYPGTYFAAVGGVMCEVVTANGDPVVLFDVETGEAMPYSLVLARNYTKAWKEADAILDALLPQGVNRGEPV